MKLLTNTLLLIVFLFFQQQAFCQLNIYPSPPSFNSSSNFSVKLNGNVAPAVKSEAKDIDMVRFSFTSTVTVEITTTQVLTNVEVRPLAYGIVPTQVSSNVWTFDLPANYAKSKVHFVGKYGTAWRDLAIIGNPPVEPVPAGAVEFANGLHTFPGDRLTLQSNTVYYLHPGAVLNTTIYAENEANITLMGNGIVKGVKVQHPTCGSCTQSHVVHFQDSDDITVKGITVTGKGWHSTVYRGNRDLFNLTIDHLTVLRAGQQTDAIGMGSYQNVNITNCFLTCGDNVLVAGWRGTMDNMLVKDCVYWPVEVGDGIFFPQGAYNSSPVSTSHGKILIENGYVLDMLPELVAGTWGKLDAIEEWKMKNIWIDPPMERVRGKNTTREVLVFDDNIPSQWIFEEVHFPAGIFTGGGHVGNQSNVSLVNSTIGGVEISSASQLSWEDLEAAGRLTIVSSGGGSNNAPSVSLTSPTNGATFTEGQSVTIQANASDSDGSITKVEFFRGSTKLGQDTSSPYSFTWTNLSAGSYSITAKAFDNDGASTTTSSRNITVTSSGGGGNGITYERFEGISGASVAALTSAPSYPNNPDFTEVRNNFSSPTNVGGNFGARMYGTLTAPETGTYYFWITGDDNVTLNLSTNSSESNKSNIAYHTGWSKANEWNKYSTQKSAGINLTAGQSYFIEALMKEAGGGDHVSVGWRKPSDGNGTNPVEVIPGSALSPGSGGGGGGSTVGLTVEIDPYNEWDFFQFRATNTSDNASITKIDLAINGGGVFDIFENGSGFSHSPNTGNNNDGVTHSSLSVNFSGSGLTAGSSKQNGTNNYNSDLDGTVNTISVTAHFNDGTSVSGTMNNVGDSDDGNSKLYRAVLTATSSSNNRFAKTPLMEIEKDFPKELLVFPNPANRVLNVDYSAISTEKAVISFYSLGGKLFQQLETQNGKATIDLQKFEAGLYFMRIVANGESHFKKIIINK